MSRYNPHVPKFISDAPWYAANEGSTDLFDHQRDKREKVVPEWYERGDQGDDSSSGNKRKKAKTLKYRKGACENCGAMTHKARDCLERPRKKGAKYTHKDIRPDDNYKQITTTYDSKRDNWNGYDVSEYQKVIDRYNEEQNKEEDDKDDSDREDKETEEQIPANQKSLRSSDDRAAYLKNLDDPTIHYNPKTRTMREPDGKINERGLYERKLTQEAKEYHKLRQAANESLAMSIEANPTASLMKLKALNNMDQLQNDGDPSQSQQAQAQSADNEKVLQSLVDKYGGNAILSSQSQKPKKSVTMAPITGVVGSGSADQEAHEKANEEETTSQGVPSGTTGTRSKYEEDVYPGNHSSVWGSYWNNHKWGYACCHSTIKQSYCMAADDG